MIEQAIALAEAEPFIGGNWNSGCSARYLKLNPMWGVKFYMYEFDRDFTWTMQNKAAASKLSPPVGEKVEAHISCFHTLAYGYLTMVASKVESFSYTKKLELYNDLVEFAGIKNDDIKRQNVGFFGGRIVCIDFDVCSYVT